METLLYLLLTLVLLSIMVVIHELGHFLFAKLFKVTVLEFSIGMGPAIFTTGKRKNNNLTEDLYVEEKEIADNPAGISTAVDSTEHTEAEKSENTDQAPANNESSDQKTVFSIRAFPIGGYVSMAGEDDSSDDKNALHRKPVWQRFLINVAGPVMNVLLGIKCEEPLKAGDTVIKVDGVRVHTGNELVYEIMNNGYEEIDLVVIRNGEEITLNNVSFPTEENSGATFGNYDFIMLAEDANFGTIMKHSVFRSFSTVKVILDSLKDLVTGRYGAEAVSGPVGMADAVGQATKSGINSLLYLFTLITMNLGVFNLLPLPALDGGRIIFLGIEAVCRKPIKREIEQTINTVGLMLLMALMLFVTMKDIFNLF